MEAGRAMDCAIAEQIFGQTVEMKEMPRAGGLWVPMPIIRRSEAGGDWTIPPCYSRLAGLRLRLDAAAHRTW